VRETLDAERVIAWLYDAPAQTVTPYASDTAGEMTLLEAWVDTPIDTLPFACTVLLESRALEIRDAQDDERVPAELAAELGIGSVRFEPLLAGRPVGMLSVEPASAGARPELAELDRAVWAALVAQAVEGVDGGAVACRTDGCHDDGDCRIEIRLGAARL
jgi:hypothetical protein